MTLEQKSRLAEQTTLHYLLNVMDSQNWDVERAMRALGIADDQRELYKRSVEYYFQCGNQVTSSVDEYMNTRSR